MIGNDPNQNGAWNVDGEVYYPLVTRTRMICRVASISWPISRTGIINILLLIEM